MLYLIGGSPRGGKTMLARRLQQERGIAVFHTDVWVRMSHKLDQVAGRHERTIGNFADQIEKMDELLVPLAEELLLIDDDVCIEGEPIFPHVAIEAAQKLGRENVRATFMVMTEPDMATIRQHEGEDDWLARESLDMDETFKGWFQSRSARCIREARGTQFPVFDSSKLSFAVAMQRAFDYLDTGIHVDLNRSDSGRSSL